MPSNTINNQFAADITTARETVKTMRRDKGARPTAVRAFLDAKSDEARQEAVEEHGAGFTRRGLREVAVFLEAHGRQDEADVFWALRDDIDVETGEVFRVDPNAEV